MTQIRVFIDGREGTTGLRIADRLGARPDVRLIPIEEDLRKDPEAQRRCMAQSDVTFLCLPDAAAIEAAELAKDLGIVLIDTSTAHRTDPDWSYGFPELDASYRERLSTADRIAAPGCHAGGFLSLVYPLRKAGILPPDYDFAAHQELVPMQPGDVPLTWADCSALERDYGFRPQVTVRTGLRRFAEWYRQYRKTE